MFPDTLPKNSRQVLAVLKKAGLLKEFYLAGGTAVALQLNHRKSLDLDFFKKGGLNSEKIAQKLSKLGLLEATMLEKNTFVGSLDKVKISFITYPYPVLFPFSKFDGIKIADLTDIALMKLTAISGRGSKKDFFDLYVIIDEQEDVSLFKLVELLDKKFKGINYNKTHILKSLTYFQDAEIEKMPKLIKNYKWKDVKQFFMIETEKVLKTL